MRDEVEPVDGALERAEDAGQGEAGAVARWRLELELADKTERKWRISASETLERYRAEEKKGKDAATFNILWANTEVVRPHLYSSTPKPDVRRRFHDRDATGKYAAEILERSLNSCIDSYDFDSEMDLCILDYLLPGRAVARVRFEPVVEEKPGIDGQPYEQMTYARVLVKRWPWERFRRGPGQTWNEVPWVAYEHQLTRDELDRQFPGFGSKVQYDIQMQGVEDRHADSEPSVFKRIRVWEIWDKEGRQVIWFAPSVRDQFLKREPDKLNLDGFFDCERPLYAIESGTTLVPISEYEMYKDQAKELDRVTTRISRLVTTLKQRGIYDSTISEMKDIFRAADNEMIPTASAAAAMQAGGLDKAVWLMPIDKAAQVLAQLIMHREQLKVTIYEIMGIGDILRGMSNPNETLGAQQLKAQTGSMRMQRRQRDVQRFIRGLLRKKAEIIAENFTPELLSIMTGVSLPTQADKQMMQQQLAVMQQQGQPVPPDAAQALSLPSWEEVMQVLKSDLLRGFRIDIETDSTVAADQAAERQQVTELITGIGGFIANIGPAVQSGAMSMETAKKIMLAAMRRFRFGREIEETIEQDMGQPPPDQGQDQAMQQAQAESQARQQELMLKQAEIEGKLALKDKEIEGKLAQKEREMVMAQELKAAQMKADFMAEMQKLAVQQAERDAARAMQPAGPAATVQLNAEDAMQQVAAAVLGMAEQQNVAASEQTAAAMRVAEMTAVGQQSVGTGIMALAEGMQTLAANIAAGNMALAESMNNLATVMAAPIKPEKDANGRIVMARRVLEPTNQPGG